MKTVEVDGPIPRVGEIVHLAGEDRIPKGADTFLVQDVYYVYDSEAPSPLTAVVNCHAGQEIFKHLVQADHVWLKDPAPYRVG